MAAERPRRLLAKKAPWGLFMAGKTERQMRQRLRSYQRNASQPMRCHYPRCAVVGSAGSLRGSGFGAAIDAHDAVFRVNAAPTAGHEASVGARTTWRVHNSEKPFFMASLGVAELQVVVCHMPWIGACQRQAFGGLYSETVAAVNPAFYSQLWSLLGRPRGKQSPSTGLLAVALALGVCDRVHLYGFSSPGEPAARCARHYWECPAWAEARPYLDPQHSHHEWLGEARLRRHWREAGLVREGAAFGTGAAAAATVRALGPRNASKVREAMASLRWAALVDLEVLEQ